MENASKALLIAGGILLVMLIIGLLFFSWSKFSDFYNKNDELAEIEDLSKFNLQFTNYQNRKVYGYELISLANRVADYNMRSSEVGQNDEKFTPIQMSFTITNEQADQYLRFSKNVPNADGIESPISQRDKLFTKTKYTQSSAQNQIIGQIFDEATRIEDIYGNADIATKLAKSINSLILSKTQMDYNKENRQMSYIQSKASALFSYNKIVANTENYIEFDDTNETSIKNAYDDMVENKLIGRANIMKYYEYYQFKSSVFECKNLTYDDVSDRVNNIEFEFKGK